MPLNRGRVVNAILMQTVGFVEGKFRPAHQLLVDGIDNSQSCRGAYLLLLVRTVHPTRHQNGGGCDLGTTKSLSDANFSATAHFRLRSIVPTDSWLTNRLQAQLDAIVAKPCPSI